MQIKHLPTTELTIHPATKSLPKIDPESAHFKALLAVVAESGIPRPVAVQQFRVVDNLDVFEAAKQLGIASLPCIEIASESVALQITADLVARPHYTKGQIAYLAYPFLKPIIEASKARRVSNLRRGIEKGAEKSQVVDFPDSLLSAVSGKTTIESLGESLGISESLLRQAKQLHELFEKLPHLRELHEPAIFETDENGEAKGLGGIYAGACGGDATRGITPMIQPELAIWDHKVSKWFDPRKWSGWDKLSEQTRQEIAARFLKQLFACAPAEITSQLMPARRMA